VTFAAPAAGRLVDRTSARAVIALSAAGLSICLMGLALVQPPLWHVWALYAVAGVVGVATSPVTHGRVVASWFDRKRGLALGLASTGIGLGAFVTPPFAQHLVETSGWRGAYMGLAAASLATVPVIWLFLRGKPQELGLLPDGVVALAGREPVASPVEGMTLGEALRTRTFWQLCAIFFCVAACVNGAVAHLVPLLTDHGVSGRSAALAMSVFGAASIVGRVGNGLLVDRFFAPRVTAVLFAGAAVGVAILRFGGTGAGAFVAAGLLGLAIGAESDLMPFLVSRYFGMRSMAELFGCAFGAYTLGNATGRYLFAVAHDAGGSYRVALMVALGVLTVAVVATVWLDDYRAAASKRGG
jgi:predicted MFS family arabinose efflux permease